MLSNILEPQQYIIIFDTQYRCYTSIISNSLNRLLIDFYINFYTMFYWKNWLDLFYNMFLIKMIDSFRKNLFSWRAIFIIMSEKQFKQRNYLRFFKKTQKFSFNIIYYYFLFILFFSDFAFYNVSHEIEILMISKTFNFLQKAKFN
jgi:hypothetical protein